MRLHWDPVKLSPETASSKGFWRRWLDGWELIIPSVGIAALALALGLPQPTLPEHLPLPTLAPRAVNEARALLWAQANAAKRSLLPFEVRAVGERFRQIGRSVEAGNALSADVQHRYRLLVTAAIKEHGAERMLELRAIQTELFVQALEAYERTGIANDDLKALGGDVLDVVKARGLIRTIPNRPKTTYRVVLEPDERRAIFLLRWTELAGLAQLSPFRLAPSWVILGSHFRLRPKLAELGQAELKLVERLKDVDPNYPAAVAKGLLLTRMGAYEAAAASFREFLAQAPDAPYRQRAKNHLAYVQQFLSQD